MKWELKYISEYCIFDRGLTYKKNDEVDFSKNAVLRSNNVDLTNNKLNLEDIKYIDERIAIAESKKIKKGSLLICMANGSKAHLGKVALIEEELNFAFGGFMGLITPKKDLDSKFLYYNLVSERYRTFINSLSDGANINNLKFSQFNDFVIPIPTLEEQRTIVAKLDQAFAAIDQAKANIEKNIANAKELFQSKLNQIFSQKGDGFIEEKLDNVLVKTKNINPKDFPGKTFRYVDVSAVDRNKLEITEFSEITSDDAPSRARKLILENDVIFATVRPTLRRVALINKDFDSQICSTGYVVLRNNKSKLLPKVIYYYLLTTSFLENIEKLQKGASYPAVTDGEVKSQLINYPISLETQQQIVDQLDQLQEQTNLLVIKYQQKLANLEELKKSILEKAFKGELV